MPGRLQLATHIAKVIGMRRRSGSHGMQLVIHTQVETDLARLTVQGPVDADNGNEVVARLSSAVLAVASRRVLVDLRLAVMLSGPLHMNQYVKQVSADPAMAACRYALLVSVRSNAYVYLADLAAQYSISLRIFTDGAQAEAWLKDADSSLAAAS
jgi:hypothetical protein